MAPMTEPKELYMAIAYFRVMVPEFRMDYAISDNPEGARIKLQEANHLRWNRLKGEVQIKRFVPAS